MSDIWQNAGTAQDDFTVDGVTFSPDPPVKGRALTFTLTGALKKAVTGGTIDLRVKYGIITVAKESTALGAAAAGPCTTQATCTIGADSPSGSYTAQVNILDQDGKEIAAVNVSFRIS
ncbi:ML domain-containing protein [Kitasatospora purpeofusca]|uniref:ML domain-containing protein n=1 Tax=Kitasatospora purpeofusca TaxID=67352 RepID=UPI003F4AC952